MQAAAATVTAVASALLALLDGAPWLPMQQVGGRASDQAAPRQPGEVHCEWPDPLVLQHGPVMPAQSGGHIPLGVVQRWGHQPRMSKRALKARLCHLVWCLLLLQG